MQGGGGGTSPRTKKPKKNSNFAAIDRRLLLLPFRRAQSDPNKHRLSMENPPSLPSSCKHEYFQSDAYITVGLLVKNALPEHTVVEWGEGGEEVKVRGKLADGKGEFNAAFRLWGKVDQAKSEVKHSQYKVELRLSKSQPGQWPSLEKKAVVDNSAPSVPVKAPTPYASKKDWNALEKEVELDTPKPSGEAALPALFQDIFKNGWWTLSFFL